MNILQFKYHDDKIKKMHPYNYKVDWCRRNKTEEILQLAEDRKEYLLVLQFNISTCVKMPNKGGVINTSRSMVVRGNSVDNCRKVVIDMAPKNNVWVARDKGEILSIEALYMKQISGYIYGCPWLSNSLIEARYTGCYCERAEGKY